MSIVRTSKLAAALCVGFALNSLPAISGDAKPAAPAAATPDKGATAEKGAAGAVGQGSWSAEVAPNAASGIQLDDKQVALTKKVSEYFNTLADMKGAFVQTTSDNKRMKGKFMIKRPGRFRFDYSLPSKQLIISDGEYLAIQDLDLNNEDRVALDQTPFRLLLRKDVDLIRERPGIFNSHRGHGGYRNYRIQVLLAEHRAVLLIQYFHYAENLVIYS